MIFFKKTITESALFIEEILLEKHQVTKALIHIEPYHMEKGS